MMTKEEKLELAEKHGIKRRHNEPKELWCWENQLLAYTSAIEEKYQVQIAQLLNLVKEEETAKLQWADRYNREVNGLNNEGDPIGGDPAHGLKHRVENLRKQVAMLQDALIHHQKLTRPIDSSIEALSATQQSADAFVAEVEARVLTDVVTAYILQPVGLDRMSLQEIVETKVAELRNSAAQPEAKGSPCVGCMYYTDSTGSWMFACPKCTKKAAQPEVKEPK